MTVNEVENFLLLNGYYRLFSSNWRVAFNGYISTITESFILSDPDKAYQAAHDFLIKNGITVIYPSSIPSGGLPLISSNGLSPLISTGNANIITIGGPNSYNVGGINNYAYVTKTLVYNENGDMVEVSNDAECDCGARICKTTHAFYCSTMKGKS